MLYFAYGSNMSARRLSHRVGVVETLGACHLPNYHLQFHKPGADGSGKCNILRTDPSSGRRSPYVLGMLYSLSRSQMGQLDICEGEGTGYQRVTVQVTNKHYISYTAQTYVALVTQSELKPFHWYKRHVIVGAEEAGLPKDYINCIERLEEIADPDELRTQTELKIYQQS